MNFENYSSNNKNNFQSHLSKSSSRFVERLHGFVKRSNPDSISTMLYPGCHPKASAIGLLPTCQIHPGDPWCLSLGSARLQYHSRSWGFHSMWTGTWPPFSGSPYRCLHPIKSGPCRDCQENKAVKNLVGISPGAPAGKKQISTQARHVWQRSDARLQAAQNQDNHPANLQMQVEHGSICLEELSQNCQTTNGSPRASISNAWIYPHYTFRRDCTIFLWSMGSNLSGRKWWLNRKFQSSLFSQAHLQITGIQKLFILILFLVNNI